MKKILIFFIMCLLISGCNSDRPKKEVQKLFSNYNNLTSDLLIQLDSVMESEDLTDEQINKYKDVLKRQYKDLKYKINDEVINQDNAIVSVEIEVYDLRSTLDNIDEYVIDNSDFYVDDKLDNEKVWDYKLDNMLKVSDRIKYNLDITLTKIDNKWQIDDLLETDRQKIHGLYK